MPAPPALRQGALRFVLDFDAQFFANLLQIILFDLLLSGDNAVVIGMAARNLSEKNRRRAIIIGGGGAIGLRIFFTLITSFLLEIPLLQFVGGLLLLWIAYKLLRPHTHAEHVSEAASLGEAVRTIVLADVVMSLDNILAISGAAHGDQALVIIGLALSIPLLLVGSDVVSRLLGRVPILVFVGAILLVWAAARMAAHDQWVEDYVRHFSIVEILAITVVISAVVVLLAQRTARRMRAAHPLPVVPAPEPAVAPRGLGLERLRPGAAKSNPDEAQAG
jgi:YjbE family integral membrane protein